MTTEIFVFGSNLAGRHGAGSALMARRHHGAVYGRGVGRQGRSYAIPTKDFELRPLPLDQIKLYVDEFFDYARAHPELRFRIVQIGCGLAGYTVYQMAPMFEDAPSNCHLSNVWLNVINGKKKGVSNASQEEQQQQNSAISNG